MHAGYLAMLISGKTFTSIISSVKPAMEIKGRVSFELKARPQSGKVSFHKPLSGEKP